MMLKNFVPGVWKILAIKLKMLQKENTGKTIMMAAAADFYANTRLGKDQVRLVYVLCKQDLQRALVILGRALIDYKSK